MISAPIPVNENERLADLYRYELLDSPYEEEFNDIVLLASKICNAPISLISLVDDNRQWFKAKVGLDTEQTDRNLSFCTHAMDHGDFMEVPDAMDDIRFYDNPLVTANPSIRYYAGVPLTTIKGYQLGTLCVIDTIPRKLGDEQAFALKVLATQIMKLIELRLRNKELAHLTETQNRIISIMAHDIRNPLVSLKSVIDLKESDIINGEETGELLPMLGKQLERTISMVNNLVDWGKLQLHLKIKPIVLNALLIKCVHQLELGILLKQNRIINRIAKDIIVETDQHALEFIIRNLLSNANKFTEAGSITISCKQMNNKTYISIEDTGIGIDGHLVPTLLIMCTIILPKVPGRKMEVAWALPL